MARRERRKRCKFCQELGCIEHCQKTWDGRHKADPKSATPADGADFVIDFNCKLCGLSGSTKINTEDIYWE